MRKQLIIFIMDAGSYRNETLFASHTNYILKIRQALAVRWGETITIATEEGDDCMPLAWWSRSTASDKYLVPREVARRLGLTELDVEMDDRPEPRVYSVDEAVTAGFVRRVWIDGVENINIIMK